MLGLSDFSYLFGLIDDPDVIMATRQVLPGSREQLLGKSAKEADHTWVSCNVEEVLGRLLGRAQTSLSIQLPDGYNIFIFRCQYERAYSSVLCGDLSRVVRDRVHTYTTLPLNLV